MNQSGNRKPLFDLGASVSQTPYINSSNNGLKFGTIFFVGVTGTWTLFDRGESVAEDNKLDAAKKVGQAIAKLLLAKGIDKVVFDRSGYLYHGRIRALADAAREAGLKF